MYCFFYTSFPFKVATQGLNKGHNIYGEFDFVRWLGGGCMKQGRDAVQTECIRIAEACLAAGKNYGDVTLKYKVSY